MTSTRTPYQDTSVPVERSKEQIRTALRSAGARGVQFDEEWSDPPTLRVRFVWCHETGKTSVVRLDAKPLPPVKGARGGWQTSPEQRERQAWRGLAWYLETNLKAATFGLVPFEAIFLAHIEIPGTPGGRTIGEHVIPQLERGHLALPPGGQA